MKRKEPCKFDSVAERTYWHEHRDRLVPRYVGRYVLLRDHEILEFGDSREEVHYKAIKRGLVGRGFLILGVKTGRKPPGVVVGI